MSEVSTINPKYSEWIKSISRNFKQCQIKAASKVNEEMLVFYWNLGKDISGMNKIALYGTDFYNKISKDLRTELPDVKSFLVTNLRYDMNYFITEHFKKSMPTIAEIESELSDK